MRQDNNKITNGSGAIKRRLPFFYDIGSTLYECEGRVWYMSLPRLIIFADTLFIMFLALQEIFYGRVFMHWNEFIIAYGAAWGAYGVKKYTYSRTRYRHNGGGEFEEENEEEAVDKKQYNCGLDYLANSDDNISVGRVYQDK